MSEEFIGPVLPSEGKIGMVIPRIVWGHEEVGVAREIIWKMIDEGMDHWRFMDDCNWKTCITEGELHSLHILQDW